MKFIELLLKQEGTEMTFQQGKMSIYLINTLVTLILLGGIVAMVTAESFKGQVMALLVSLALLAICYFLIGKIRDVVVRNLKSQ